MRRLHGVRRPLLLMCLLLLPPSLYLMIPAWSVAQHRGSPKNPTPTRRSPPPQASMALAQRCGIRADYNQAELDAVCESPSTSSGTSSATCCCRVARIGHLDQSGFVESRLRQSFFSSLKVFIFPPSDLISGNIARRGSWEGASVNFLTTAMRAWPGSALVDVGSGLGVFTLNAARVGRRVLAIDSNYQNAIRLAKSTSSNSYSSLIHVYWNAVSNLPSGTELYMRLPPDCNMGGGFPAPSDATERAAATGAFVDHIRVRAAGLDQLTSAAAGHLADASAVFLKLDIEGQEWSAITTGQRLFSSRIVPLVMMEWTATRNGRPDRATFVARFFADRGYRPHFLAAGGVGGGARRRLPRVVALHPTDWRSWPGDILWARNMTQLINSWR